MKKRLLIKIIAVLVLIISIGKNSNAQSGWEEVFSISDRFMRDICFVPGTDGMWNTGWAIAAEGEIFKTTDGGETWRELNTDNGLELLHIGSLYMHPENPDILLAAAGHLLQGDDVTTMETQGLRPSGIYRTKDGGENWEKVLVFRPFRNTRKGPKYCCWCNNFQPCNDHGTRFPCHCCEDNQSCTERTPSRQ